MPEQDDEVVRFRPTGGRVMGSLAVVAALAVVLVAVSDRGVVPLPVVAGAVLVGVLGWASMLWPGLSVTRDELVLRTMFEHVRLPLAAIESIAVRQVLAVRVGEKRYVSTAIGKNWRRAMVGDKNRTRKDSDRPVTEVDYAEYVEQEIYRRMEHARAVTGVGMLSDEQLALAAGVRRTPAWLPIGLVAAALIGLVVSVVA
ncbi:hypothetical protein [Nocardioides currus]|uniref:PH domain-containing protein n=1 Tax=Nocardioides currus TaxID=2133958 RepID=A0A2R7YZR4_9ACTN|nr:hypothetical protein [Nocardioides currus]PUA81875.1 hypothetical protein C7S10_07430 [Nocardioides currus]